MPFTREERQLIEEIVNRLIKLQNRVTTLEEDMFTVQEFLETLKNITAFSDLSDAEIKLKIANAVQELINELPTKLHTHLSDQEGGPAFARKGARLID